jgi:hypothetical protein
MSVWFIILADRSSILHRKGEKTMKFHFSFSVVITLLALILITGGALALAQQVDKTQIVPDSVSSTAGNPWQIYYIQRDVEPPLLVGSYLSLAIRSYDDLPMISYYDQTHGNLMIAAPFGSGNCGENDAWNCIVVDGNAVDVGSHTSIDVWVDSEEIWKYGISYYDSTNHALKLYTVSYDNGQATGGDYTIRAPDSEFVTYGSYSSFKFTSTGEPHIVYYTSNAILDDSLWHAYPVESGGDCGEGDAAGLWECELVDSGNRVGQHISMDMSYEDEIRIAYYDAGSGNLKYAYYAGIGNCGEGDQWQCNIIDGTDGSDVGLYTSIKAPRFMGDPFRIAYYDKTNGNLKFYASAPLNWIVIVDSMGTNLNDMGISMDMDKGGYPVIAYQQVASDGAPAALRIARPAEVYDEGKIGNCGEIPPGNIYLYWQCDTLDNAGAYTDEANYVSLTVRSNGLAMIAYTEDDEFYNIRSLKIVYQYAQSFLPLMNK